MQKKINEVTPFYTEEPDDKETLLDKKIKIFFSYFYLRQMVVLPT